MVRFNYGVASGDPLADRVILWTHASHADFGQPSGTIPLEWEVALDNTFEAPVSRGTTTATEGTAFTVKVDATGLRPGTRYFYRFRAGEFLSPVGITRTLPERDIDKVRLAVFSCSNYPAGLFHLYSEAVRSRAEFAIHLGDYIYEYAADGYASEDAVALDRVVEPPHEILTLDDYRRRYAQYRTDPDLKNLHASMPMIAVWDDHEISNDTWREGAQNHTEGLEGRFADRRAAALQAYHEWLPIRTVSGRHDEIWRSFDFGSLLSLHMLDTRVAYRDKQLTLSDLGNPATHDEALQRLFAPDRQLLGERQQQWLYQQLQTSEARWQVLGQQVLMARLQLPLSIMRTINPSNLSPAMVEAAIAAVRDYAQAKRRARLTPARLTGAQRALLDREQNPLIGYNLDAWDGYPAAREALLEKAHSLGKPLVVLAGDTHNGWHSNLTLQDGTVVGEEFATASVSSPGLEYYLGSIMRPETAEELFLAVADDLKYINARQRGFLLMEFTRSAVTGHWIYIDSVKSPGCSFTTERTAIFSEAAAASVHQGIPDMAEHTGNHHTCPS